MVSTISAFEVVTQRLRVHPGNAGFTEDARREFAETLLADRILEGAAEHPRRDPDHGIAFVAEDERPHSGVEFPPRGCSRRLDLYGDRRTLERPRWGPVAVTLRRRG